jgi:DNA-directed RNA polymerase specialized sigma24 family protein
MNDESVSEWIDDLKAGSDVAAQRVWERYFEKLVRLARRKLSSIPRVASDEEDIALSALDSFCRHAANGRFPRLEDRNDLWKLLFTITERKAGMQVKHALRQKRGGGRHIQSLQTEGDSSARHEQPIAPEPSPDFAMQLAEEMSRLLDRLQDEALSRIALMKMEGFTNDEIAQTMGISTRTIIRKLQVIRTIWSSNGSP